MVDTPITPETDGAAPIDVSCISIAFDCSDLNRNALEAAVSLAAATHARVEAVFVEDQCLFELARLPVARHVSRSGRQIAHPDTRQVTSEIKRAAQLARHALSDAAGRARVEWAFDTVRGMLADALQQAGNKAEILALGSSQARIGRVHSVSNLRRVLRHGTGVIVAPSRVGSPHGPILAVVGPGADPGIVVRTAEKIAARTGRQHRFAIACAASPARRELERRVAELRTVEAPLVRCDSDQLASVTWCVRRERPSLVIADIDYACFDEATSTESVSESFGAALLLIQV
jgi:hypothetical protein